mmetsp:Transcript_323/g.776  ORF Transcript_323/g.776 Transcript_323/m.776 type:complete len:84 (-) Transcript_323:1780-2031(-)
MARPIPNGIPDPNNKAILTVMGFDEKNMLKLDSSSPVYENTAKPQKLQTRIDNFSGHVKATPAADIIAAIGMVLVRSFVRSLL